MAESNDLVTQESFLQEVTEIIRSNLSDEQFGVLKLSSAVGISRSQLYRRIHDITGSSINTFIREVRLREAQKLILEGTHTATDVAYEVGFGSPSYFTKCYHEYFGYTPGQTAQISLRAANKNKSQPWRSLWGRRGSFTILTFVLTVTSVAILIIVLINPFESFPTNSSERITLLPFEQIYKDEDYNYLTEGIRESILTQLTKIQGLVVVNNTSAGNSVKKVAKDLDVDFVMQGAVERNDSKVRIQLRLIEGSTGNIVWAEDYTRNWSDIFKIYTEISISVAKALEIIITDKDLLKLADKESTNVTAYDYVLQARHEKWKFWNSHYLDTMALRNAERMYKQALKLDSTYALAWNFLGSNAIDRRAKTHDYYLENYLDSGLWYSRKSIEVDPNSPDAYFQAGLIYHLRGKIDKAKEYYEKCRKLRDSNPLVEPYVSYKLGIISIFRKEYTKGLEQMKRSSRLFKGYPNEYLISKYWLGVSYYMIGAYQKALEQFLEVRTLGDCHPISYYYHYKGEFKRSLHEGLRCFENDSNEIRQLSNIANNYLQLGLYEQSLQYFEQYRNRFTRLGWAELNSKYREGYVLIKLGRVVEGERLVSEELSLLNRRKDLKRSDDHYYHLAAIHAFQNDTLKALEYLKLYNKADIHPMKENFVTPLGFSRYDILFKSIWDNPQFKELIRKNEAELLLVREQILTLE